MIKAPNTLISLAAVVSLSACTIFPQAEPPRLMELSAPERISQAEQMIPVALRVDTPLASEPLESTRILVKPSPYEFQALPQFRWRDTAPVVVRDYLIQGLRQSAGFNNIMTDTSPATAAYTLVSELSGFHAEVRRSGTIVVVHLHAELLDNRTRNSLCVLDERQEALVSGAGIESLMAAFSDSASALSGRVTDWARACLGPE
ncbi:MAG TPA: ABC-type transport auxiliary lipoprotein family protein [Marinobacter sp.]|nr:ABC-type transport auxiliary lipoprotein family protein [Marinobacter sp.]